MSVGSDRFQIIVHRQQDIGGAGKGWSEAFLDGFNTPALPQETMAPSRTEIRKAQSFQLAQALDLGPELGLGTRIENIEGEAPLSLGDLARS